MSLATVSTVRTSPSNLELFVRYHLGSGIERMFLFFDDPDDPSIGPMRAREEITCIPCDAAHWRGASLGPDLSIEARQTHNADLALAWAREAGIGWIAHIDADELLFVGGRDLADYVAAVPADCDALAFRTWEALPEAEAAPGKHPFLSVTWFKTQDSPILGARTLARLLGAGAAMTHGYFKGHTEGKSVVRTSAPVASLEIHRPRPLPGAALRVERPAEAALLHFDGCTFEDWVLKWKRRYDRTAVAANMREERQRQFAEFVEACQSGDEARLRALYRRRYTATARQRLALRTAGLLRRIEIGEERFAAPAVAAAAPA